MTKNLHAHGERMTAHEFGHKPRLIGFLWCTDGAQFWEKFVQILTIIYPQIATEPGPRRDLGEEHNTMQNTYMFVSLL